MDSVYDLVDDLVTANNVEAVETLLVTVGILAKYTPVPVLLAVLTGTLPWVEKLGRSREDFYRTVRQRILSEHSESETSRLLSGLEGKEVVRQQLTPEEVNHLLKEGMEARREFRERTRAMTTLTPEDLLRVCR